MVTDTPAKPTLPTDSIARPAYPFSDPAKAREASIAGNLARWGNRDDDEGNAVDNLAFAARADLGSLTQSEVRRLSKLARVTLEAIAGDAAAPPAQRVSAANGLASMVAAHRKLAVELAVTASLSHDWRAHYLAAGVEPPSHLK